MSAQGLLDKYQDSPRLFQLADRLSFAQPQKLHLKNLRGSSSQFVAAAVFVHPSCSQLNHLFICNDEEDAAYFHNTLENLTCYASHRSTHQICCRCGKQGRCSCYLSRSCF